MKPRKRQRGRKLEGVQEGQTLESDPEKTQCRMRQRLTPSRKKWALVCCISLAWLLTLSGPLLPIYQMKYLESEGTAFSRSLAPVAQSGIRPPSLLPSAHLSHQPQHIFGVLNSLLQVLDGFLHSMGLIRGEVHPAFEYIGLDENKRKDEVFGPA